MKHSPFNVTILALDAETSALGAVTSELDAMTSALGAATLALTQSFWQHRRGVSCDIGNCGVGITPQMCNRVTNHGDVGTFSRPVKKVPCF